MKNLIKRYASMVVLSVFVFGTSFTMAPNALAKIGLGDLLSAGSLEPTIAAARTCTLSTVSAMYSSVYEKMSIAELNKIGMVRVEAANANENAANLTCVPNPGSQCSNTLSSCKPSANVCGCY